MKFWSGVFGGMAISTEDGPRAVAMVLSLCLYLVAVWQEQRALKP